MLSANNAAQYEKFYSGFGPAATASGVPYRRVQVMYLRGPGSDAAKTGVTLGGGAITEDGHWAGTWSPLPSPASDGQ